MNVYRRLAVACCAVVCGGMGVVANASPPASWLHAAACVHAHESTDWHRAGRDWRGRPSPYFGGMQFDLGTWRAVGGHGLPSDASPSEQYERAYRLWRRYGWRPWQRTASECGLR